MGVPCPGCGRSYDVTLFEFGRTLHCTCGRRVGLAPRVRSVLPEDPPRFAADAMLGRLAHWLRILGFDCRYEPGVSDADLARRAVEEERVVLTRDRAFPEEWRGPAVRVLRAEATFEQLREVVRAFDLAARIRLFSRCNRCNAPLERASREEARGRVPARVWEHHERFRRCPACGRLYWEGSHVRRMRRVVDALLAEPGAGESPDRASR